MTDLPHEAPQVDEITALVTHLQQVRQENGYSTSIWSDERLNRAAQGLNEFKKITEVLPPDLARKLVEAPGLQMCFLGIAPVEHFKTKLSEAEVEQINVALALRGEKYFVISYPYPLSKSRNKALINLEAAETIMKDNGDLFKDVGNPRNFLKTQPKAYLAPAAFISGKIQDQRHGVLAGYPRDNVDTWSRINNGFGKDRFINRPKTFGAGDGKEGFYFEGFNERDKQWANEAIALRKATKISEVKV